MQSNLGQQSNLNPGQTSNQELANAEKASIQHRSNNKKMRKGKAIKFQCLHNYSTTKISLSLGAQPTKLSLKRIASPDIYGSLLIIVFKFA